MGRGCPPVAWTRLALRKPLAAWGTGRRSSCSGDQSGSRDAGRTRGFVRSPTTAGRVCPCAPWPAAARSPTFRRSTPNAEETRMSVPEMTLKRSVAALPDARAAADGRAHAERRRHRGHPPDRRLGQPGAHHHPHHPRPRRVRLRRPARRRERLPAQGRAAAGAGRGDPRRGPRRRPARRQRHPPAARPLRRRAARRRRPAGRPRRADRARAARCCASWRSRSPTPRSPRGWC